ncbi:hypothetical protein E2320_005705 [Naja naja]|nr:hypothetical protein E2320_005705 [Naja naja]
MEPAGSRLRGKPFYGREWALGRLALSLERGGGVLITGGPGSGKTALCTEALWPTSAPGLRVGLGDAALAWHFCQAHDAATCTPRGFLLRLMRQVERCPLLPGYRERLRRAGAPQPLEAAACQDPDELFRRAVLLPLLDLPPPTRPLLIVVDALDAAKRDHQEEEEEEEEERGPTPGPSKSIAQLLGSHLRLLPPWLLLVCSARSHSQGVLRLFPGFRQLCLDDLQGEPVICDVQHYILARLDREAVLRQRFTQDVTGALTQLPLKSNGCLLYLEQVLDRVAEALITPQEVHHIPGTLAGLYLWLCQRLFPHNRGPAGSPSPTDLAGASRCHLDVPPGARESFQNHLATLAGLLQQGPGDTCTFFHLSFAEWLCDVKHCTWRYHCCPARGHALLAMRASCQAPDLSPKVVIELARHLLAAQLGLEAWQLALWLVWCRVPVECCLGAELLVPLEPAVLELLVLAGARLGEPGPAPSLHQALQREDSVQLLLANGTSVNQRDVDRRTWLASAAHSGSHEVVGLLLTHGAHPEAPDPHGQTPMTVAARQGHTKALLCLLAHGAKVDWADDKGWTALRAAAWSGHSKAVGVLLQAGARVDCADTEGRTALRAAAWGGHEDIVATLLEHGADVNRADSEGRTPLIAAAYMGHGGIVALLLSHGAHVDHADTDGRTALSVAAMCIPVSQGCAKVVELLLDHGASPGQADRDNVTPLLVAACEGHVDVVELLLEAGAEVDQADSRGCTPLLAASSMGHRAAVETLLLWGAAIDILDSEGRSALGLAAGQGSEAVVQALLKRGLDGNHPDGLGWTPLHLAAWQGHHRTCAALLEAGARVGEPNQDGHIPLMLAAREGHTDAVQLLLEHHSPIDHQGHDGLSALSLAMLAGHHSTAELLLCKGAEVNLSDSEGRPLLYLLMLEGHVEMARLLLEHGARLEGRDAQGRTALHVTCWQGQGQATQLLLSYGADVDALDKEGRSALHQAAWQGHGSIAHLLLGRGAQPNHICSQGATALGVATQEGWADVVKVLLEHRASPDVRDKAGHTPRWLAAKRGQQAMLKLMEGYGAWPGLASPQLASSSSSTSSPVPQRRRGKSPAPWLGSTNESQASQGSSATTSTFPSLATPQTTPPDSLSGAQQMLQSSPPHWPQPGPFALPPPPAQETQSKAPRGGSISMDTLAPHLHRKAAIKLQFEGPTCGYHYKQETPL